MELRQLQTFRTVAKTLSFTRAAEVLNYAQSSVSAQIHELEMEYDTVLFERLGRKVMLTNAGTRLLQYAEKILDLAAEARNAVADDEEPAGYLTITSPESLCAYRLPAVLEQLRQRYPRIDLIFKPMINWEELERQLTEGAADAALEIMEPHHHPNLVLEPLRKEPIYVLAHSGHRLVGQSQVSASDLRSETLLLTENGCTYRALFERTLAQAGVRPSTVLEFHSVEAIKQCALGGLGIAVLPELAVRHELAEERLVILPFPAERHFELITYLAWHKDKWQSPALRAFLSVTRAVLGELDVTAA